MLLSLNRGKYAAFSSQAELQAELASRGYSTFFWQDPPGTCYPEHHHDHNEVIVVFAGSFVFSIEGKVYQVEKGDELLLPGGTRHAAVNKGSTAVSYFICS